MGVVQECEVPHISLKVAKSSCFRLLYAHESARVLTRVRFLNSYANRGRKRPDPAHVGAHMRLSFSSF